MMFVMMAIEGPIVGAIAGFLASLGIFNVGMVWLMFVLGDVVPDATYYWIGYFSRDTLFPKIVKFFRIKKESVDKAEKYLHENQVKALAIFKFTPFIAVSGLILSGVSKMPFRRFFMWDVFLALPNALLFVGTGYLLGEAAGPLLRSVKNFQEGLLIAVVSVAILYMVIKLIRKLLDKKVVDIIR